MKALALAVFSVFSVSFIPFLAGDRQSHVTAKDYQLQFHIEFSDPTCTPSPPPTKLPVSLAEDTPAEAVDGILGIVDWDCDGVRNAEDNCLFVFNPNQIKDPDNEFGVACDPKVVARGFKDSRCDDDGDGIPNFRDNCPAVCNPDQKFEDDNKNGANDLCENTAKKKFPAATCEKRIEVKPPTTPIPEQSAAELIDSLGNGDWDCDGRQNSRDNCIFVYNPKQRDRDGNGKGDACDPKLVDPALKASRCDQDGDGIPDFKDNCPAVCNPDQEFHDENKNGTNDLCENTDTIKFPSMPCQKKNKVKHLYLFWNEHPNILHFSTPLNTTVRQG